MNESGSCLGAIFIFVVLLLLALVPLRYVPAYRMSDSDMYESFGKDMHPATQVRGIIHERTGYNMPIVDEPGDPVFKSKLNAWDALVNLTVLASFMIFVPIAYVIAGIGGVVAGFVNQDWGAIFLSLFTILCAVLPLLGGLIWWLLLLLQPASFNYQLIWATLGLAVAFCGSALGLCMVLVLGIGGESSTIFVRIWR